MLLDGNMMDIEPEEWTGIVGTDLDSYPAIKEIVDFTAGWSTQSIAFSWFIFVAEFYGLW